MSYLCSADSLQYRILEESSQCSTDVCRSVLSFITAGSQSEPRIDLIFYQIIEWRVLVPTLFVFVVPGEDGEEFQFWCFADRHWRGRAHQHLNHRQQNIHLHLSLDQPTWGGEIHILLTILLQDYAHIREKLAAITSADLLLHRRCCIFINAKYRIWRAPWKVGTYFVAIFQVARNPLKWGMTTLFVLKKNVPVFIFQEDRKVWTKLRENPPHLSLCPSPNNAGFRSLRTKTLCMCVLTPFPALEGNGGGGEGGGGGWGEGDLLWTCLKPCFPVCEKKNYHKKSRQA